MGIVPPVSLLLEIQLLAKLSERGETSRLLLLLLAFIFCDALSDALIFDAALNGLPAELSSPIPLPYCCATTALGESALLPASCTKRSWRGDGGDCRRDRCKLTCPGPWAPWGCLETAQFPKRHQLQPHGAGDADS